MTQQKRWGGSIDGSVDVTHFFYVEERRYIITPLKGSLESRVIQRVVGNHSEIAWAP